MSFLWIKSLAGERKIGISIILFSTLMLMSSTVVTYLYNPFYLFQYISTILLFGQGINILIWIFFIAFSLWYFMDIDLSFFSKKRTIGFMLITSSFSFFITSIFLMSGSPPIVKFSFIDIEELYRETFMVQIVNINTISEWNGMQFNLVELGMIFPLFYWIFSLFGLFMPIITIASIILILYSLNIIILNDYQFFIEKLFFLKKDKINVKRGVNNVDLNQETEEFKLQFSDLQKQKGKKEILKKVKANMNREDYRDDYSKLSQKIKTEKEKLESLRSKVISKVQEQNKNQRNKTKISEKERSQIIDSLGTMSYSKIKMLHNEKAALEKNRLQKRTEKRVEKKVEKNVNNIENDGNWENLSDNFISFLTNEMLKNKTQTEEFPLIVDYYDEIFKNEDELIKQVETTLEHYPNIENKKKLRQATIGDFSKVETVTRKKPLPEKTEEIRENTFSEELSEEVLIEEPSDKVFKRPVDWCKPYVIPTTSILSSQASTFDNQKLVDEATNKSNKINGIFDSFGVKANVNSFVIGPTVSVFKVELEAGVKTTKVISLEDNIKLALGAEYIRLLAPIPGTSFIGIEVPNSIKKPVLFKSVFNECSDKSSGIQISIGQDVSGKPLSFDLTKAPHLLVAGSTGSGKSVGINTILASILLRYKPTDVQLLLVDPKMVEFAPFHGIPHLMAEVITDATNANSALKAMVQEMELRYKIMAEKGAKKIDELNGILVAKGENKLPYIVIIIDELADLMMVSSKEVEESIMRITQKARAAGIHMVIATQRPSIEVITGTIKSNIPSRIAFTVASSIDSRTILGASGAEKLVGMGDMLVSMYGKLPFRGQGAFISNEDIEELTSYVKTQCEPYYLIDVEKFTNTPTFGKSLIDLNDPIYIAAKDTILHYQKASTSMLQRHLNIGYNKAATIIDTLENEKIIGPSKGTKPREVLLKE